MLDRLGVGMAGELQASHGTALTATGVPVKAVMCIEPCVSRHLYVPCCCRAPQGAAEVDGICINDTSMMEAGQAALPFDLTAAQQRALDEILADMQGPSPMMRLLQVVHIPAHMGSRAISWMRACQSIAVLCIRSL